jgi:uncharacterized protein YhaN
MQPAFAAEPIAVIISGGGQKDDNHFRYENNVRLYQNVLSESGYSKDRIRIFFQDGVDSVVKDFDSKNPLSKDLEYGIKSNAESLFRPNRIRDIINEPAKLASIQKEFDRVSRLSEEKKVPRVVLFTTDHGTPNTSDYKQSFITLAGEERLPLEEQERFVQRLVKNGTSVALVGDQCFSGHNMQIALRQPNSCAFSATTAFEQSYSLVEDTMPQGANAPHLGYSTYAFLFACALHKKGVAGNQAAAHCPKELDADIDEDKRVTLAEAHFYALTQMPPESSPQISSQVFAQTVLQRKSKRPEAAQLAGFCQPDDSISDLVNLLGRSVDPALGKRIEARLSMERKAIATLLQDKDLLFQIKSKSDEPFAAKIRKLQGTYQEFQEAYDQIQSELRSALANINKSRKTNEALKEKALSDILNSDPSPELRSAYDAMKEAEKRLDDTTLPEEQRQIEQNRYNRNVRVVGKAIDQATGKAPWKRQFQDLNTERQRAEQDFRTAVDRETAYLTEYANVRRAFEMLTGYFAQTDLMKSGTPEEKAKLVQLYECEDQTL